MGKKYDYIIIGQGIAGSSFAWNLYFKNKSFIIIDSENENTSSKAALGIFNPITGRRNALSWNYKSLFTELNVFYSKVENELKTKILYKKNIYRPFKNIIDYNDWIVKTNNDNYIPFIKEINDTGLLTKKSGYLDVNKYLSETKKYFKSEGRYIQCEIINNDFILERNTIKIKNIEAKYIIMCLGIKQNTLDHFSQTSIRPVSGNSIIVESNFQSEKIINNKISIINYKKNKLMVGSTYNNGFEDTGILFLIKKLKEIIKTKFKVIESKFGVRPASSDRRPIVGRHFRFKNLFILNGLGSKGVSLSPYCSKELINYIENNKKLIKEINIERFKS